MSTINVTVPGIGDFKDVPITQLLVKPGDVVKAEDPLITLESDKATIDVPAPQAGTVRELLVKVGDRVSEGKVIALLDAAEEQPAPAPPAGKPAPDARAPAPKASESPKASAPPKVSEQEGPGPSGPAARPPAPVESGAQPVDEKAFKLAHASPSVRAFARELGVDVSRVKGTGPKGRILKEDVQGYVKAALRAPAAGSVGGAGLTLLPWPAVDFARHGPIETRPLTRIQKISGANLSRNWVMIPHVTQHEEADITELEAFRVELNKEQEKAGVKVTLLAFIMKAAVVVLRRFPELNASIQGEELVLKQYYHLGFAADTPAGLVVPVVKDVDTKGILDLATETAALAKKAREGKLSPAEMQGGTFTISSLGGIGGTAFTPIINAPEVAVLGVSRSTHRPVWNGSSFEPRLMVPLSLSYDHRVIDGATAARICVELARVLKDMRRSLL